jgi:predicted NAD/FAD-dependent oxidoreductase
MGGYVPRVAVVGGGVSGLVLAKQLAARGIHATVFDTGEHACGGRASSRDVTTDKGRQHSFDHSTQYFTASPGSRFEKMTKDWAAEGLITQWPQGKVGNLTTTTASEGGGDNDDAAATAAAAAPSSSTFVPFADDAKRFIGVGGLRPLCDFLAEGASEVVRPQWVGAMTPVGGDGASRRWELASGPGGKRLGTFDFVAISHNGKCAARLASTAKHADGSAAAEKVNRSLQCAFGIRPTAELANQRKLILSSVWALMLVTDQPLGAAAGFEGAHVAGSDVISWASNVTAKRRHGGGGGRGGGGGGGGVEGEGGECWVVHSTPQFARDHKCPQESILEGVEKEVTVGLVGTPGCEIGYTIWTNHTGCHQLNRVLTAK